MKALRHGLVAAPLIGILWTMVAATTVAVAMSFATGDGYKPALAGCVLFGVLAGLFCLSSGLLKVSAKGRRALRPRGQQISGMISHAGLIGLVTVLGILLTRGPLPPVLTEAGINSRNRWLAAGLTGLAVAWPLMRMLADMPFGRMSRHLFEQALIRFLLGFGYVFFTAIVLIPFYVMVMTSLKSQQALLQNPLDFSIDLSRGMEIFRSYSELFGQFNFGSYLWTSFYVSILTVLITLLFSIPGAYAVARLRFKGSAVFSRTILLIYMVPLIVLALPIYIVFSMTGLRNTILGIVLIYPVTTIPVALYMLQGYFRGLPEEVEEAGLMDGLSRLQVIRKITLPLALPALVSVSLYVFMIAWNEFLLAFMLLDDPAKFTLTRGVSMLNSSEIPRQHLMAGAVIATVPIMVLFLSLERFMTKGLTAGSVKG